MANDNGFTVAAGLATQAEQLAEWKARLNAECFGALQVFAARRNAELNEATDTGYDVARGSTLAEFVHNWYPVPAERVSVADDERATFRVFYSHPSNPSGLCVAEINAASAADAMKRIEAKIAGAVAIQARSV